MPGPGPRAGLHYSIRRAQRECGEAGRLQQGGAALRFLKNSTTHLPSSSLAWQRSTLHALIRVMAFCTDVGGNDVPLLGPWFPAQQYHKENNDLSSQSQDITIADDTLTAEWHLHPEEHVYREPTTHQLDWRISAGYRRPDGVLKRVYLINDANAMDGVIGVTQCGILHRESFVYNFTISPDQSGTFWYHAHSAAQRADGLYGGLVVHKPAPKPRIRGLWPREDQLGADSFKYGYDREVLLLVGDWYHRPAEEVSAWYLRAGSYGNEPVPDSVLVNGAGRFNCSMAVPARPVDCIGEADDRPKLFLDAKTTYRIRVVNTGSLAGFTLTFARETLELIQLDGGIPVEPQLEKDNVNSAGILFPGQRMDFILRQPAGRTREKWSSLTVDLDQGCFKYPNPALTPRHVFPIIKQSINPTAEGFFTKELESEKQNPTQIIDITKIPSASSVLAVLPPKAQQTHVVYTKIEKLSRLHNVPYGFFNRTTWRPQSDPPVPLIGLAREKWDENQFAVSVSRTGREEPVWVDLVVNNLDEGAHPFHLHGHNFYIVAIHESTQGWGSYNPFLKNRPPGLELSSNDNDNDEDTDPYDLTRAVLRDTVQIPRRGYAVLRFRADNPGIWFFHCHIMWHLAGGMAMLVDVMGEETSAHQTGISSCRT
ncbi:Ferro-O2-oxidoreductase [Rasamsonia emersonii CBS 393.64]|uniref:Ferro-O2-oxidoreductase n=1 Tax=Rasamsonia emersonii (strain ATCC 16479 / CBS 393.64 / IMI 116815) TaxID=1408163 RepID=A0A0F4Z0U8_RASE3|nr:Ferro-O2-oxidoreductase [Rasamsonia emersonii CBS 393.64]KKA24127.1 Ferro-O2-oxidoreductase [Rasamsonia emersonii CBS 393.64]